MSMWMINVRMRRIDLLTKHRNWEADAHYKCYQGAARTWMLTDNHVFHVERDAKRALLLELDRIQLKRRAQVRKLDDEMAVLRQEIAQTVRTQDAAFESSFRFDDDE